MVNVSKDIGRLLQTMRLTARLDVREASENASRPAMDDGLLKEFINESREHLATIEVDLLVALLDLTAVMQQESAAAATEGQAQRVQ